MPIELVELPEPSPEERARRQAILDALPRGNGSYSGYQIGDVELRSEYDDEGWHHIVVTRADPATLISYELLVEANSAPEKTIGALTLDGDVLSFGTPGMGQGRLNYRIVDSSDRYRTALIVRVDLGEVGDRD